MGEFGFDYDTGDVTYHHDDGFVTSDSGEQYLEIGGGHVVDLESNEIHYSPSAGSATHDYSTDISIWAYIGVICLLFCLVYVFMVFHTDVKYFFRAVIFGILAFLSFSKAKASKI